MTYDIVARLRVLTKTLLLGDFKGLAKTTESAADEIERLRACVSEANAYMAEAALAIERLRARVAELEREVRNDL